MRYSSFPDTQLLPLIQAGNQEAFAEIYQRYWSVMYMHALKMLKDEEDARDTVQEVFTSFWNKAESISSDLNLSGYLFVITKNKVLGLIAQRKVRTAYAESLAVFMGAYQNDTIEAITQKELMQALDIEIERLPAKMKAIFEMRAKRHMSYKAIAEELEISDKTVKKQINNAINILRPKMSGITGWAAFLFIIARH
jgi:RNA polymerase sigma-70 factor (family 1)